jgi:signal transduction histidine kinase
LTTLEELRRSSLFDGLTDEQLRCLIEEGSEVRVSRGELYAREGEPIEHLYVVLEGELRITKLVDGREMVINNYTPGVFFGEVPLLAGTPFLASGRALEDSRLFAIPEKVFRWMLTAYPTFSHTVLETMAQRVQGLQSIAQERERLNSLGTLAAGLAHELNNPAAASLRAAGRLRECFEHLRKTGMKISRSAASGGLGPEQLNDLDRIVVGALGSTDGVPDDLSPLEAADREENLARWLEDRSVKDAWDMASTLAQASLEVPDLELVVGVVGRDCLDGALKYLEAVLAVAGLVEEVEASTTRVSALVETMKAYSHMDQAPLQEVQINEDLDNTVEILAFELEEVEVVREYDDDLPRITAYGGELNQVWTALIDNALDAIKGEVDEPRITLRTACEGDRVLVEVADNGPGVPEELQARVFEPYFTTKGVGAGSGLGLDVTYRIVVGRHGGDIRVLSRPGDTRFQVRLPLEVDAGIGATAEGGQTVETMPGGDGR